ncbi:TetR family transcriptional regulator [Sphingomonas sp.]|uniref:TetR/AcrR family transcriptional regulator n=1 Tax=Sphingomonas sp. TaxID=28214 RepID=UPI00286C9B2B|nr:TetR family transcriptional regulator [Sphingomonas sp.]
MGRPATAKKDRLIDAAMVRFHHDGVIGASLATVARDADVAPGNVYYYFQSKEALTEAVIARWCDRVIALLARHEEPRDPLDRVRSYLSGACDRRFSYTDHGCPLAAIASHNARPLELIRAWLTDQFAQVDPAPAQARADFCMASLQGSFALAHAAGDPAIIARNIAQLRDWIDSLSAPI